MASALSKGVKPLVLTMILLLLGTSLDIKRFAESPMVSNTKVRLDAP